LISRFQHLQDQIAFEAEMFGSIANYEDIDPREDFAPHQHVRVPFRSRFYQKFGEDRQYKALNDNEKGPSFDKGRAGGNPKITLPEEYNHHFFKSGGDAKQVKEGPSTRCETGSVWVKGPAHLPYPFQEYLFASDFPHQPSLALGDSEFTFHPGNTEPPWRPSTVPRLSHRCFESYTTRRKTIS
ncbi:Hypothetical predicted protein, partial [Paramuricea clavata]